MPLLDTCDYLKTQKSPNKNFSFWQKMTCQWPLKSAPVSVCLTMTKYFLALKIGRVWFWQFLKKSPSTVRIKNINVTTVTSFSISSYNASSVWFSILWQYSAVALNSKSTILIRIFWISFVYQATQDKCFEFDDAKG